MVMQPDQPADRRDYLIAARDRLHERLLEASDAYIAPISKQLAAVVKELDELPNGEAEVSTLDELRRERAARSAESPATTGRRSQQRRRGRLQAG
jgi:hypothetical protein